MALRQRVDTTVRSVLYFCDVAKMLAVVRLHPTIIPLKIRALFALCFISRESEGIRLRGLLQIAIKRAEFGFKIIEASGAKMFCARADCAGE